MDVGSLAKPKPGHPPVYMVRLTDEQRRLVVEAWQRYYSLDTIRAELAKDGVAISLTSLRNYLISVGKLERGG